MMQILNILSQVKRKENPHMRLFFDFELQTPSSETVSQFGKYRRRNEKKSS